MKRVHTLAGCALLFLCACGGSGGGSGSVGPPGGGGNPPPPPGPEEVTIARDVYGVPHVFAKTDAGAMYGLGWASAEDRLFQMTRARLMIEGRVAEFFGPGTVVEPGGTTDYNRRHDRESRAIGWRRHAVRAAEALDPATRELLQAYCDGVNAAIADPAFEPHPFFAQFGVPIEPWTPVDCISMWLRFGRHFSASGLDEDWLLHQWQALLADPKYTYEQTVEIMLGARVCDDETAVVQESDVPSDVRQAMADYAAALGLSNATNCPMVVEGPHFSQAWAVAGQRTTTGNAVLVADPRIPVFVPNILYEWSVSGKTFAVRGVGVAGTPLLLAGSSENVAWAPTALGTDQTDLFQIQIDDVNHPGQYFLDGQWVDFLVDEDEIILVNGIPNPPDTIRYRETYWGPVVTRVTTDPQPGEEFALKRIPLVDPASDPTAGFFAMYRAEDIEELDDALDGWTWPAVNLVFADKHGRIGYAVVGSIPIRNPSLDLAGIVAQDGTKTSSDWVDILPPSLAPRVLDPAAGILFSANHMPVGSWYPIPVRWGTGGVGDTPRSLRLRERLLASPGLLSPVDIFDVHHDVVHTAYRGLVELGLWLRDGQSALPLSGNARRALDEVEGWWQQGALMDNSHHGTALVAQLDLSFRPGPLTDPLIQLFGQSQNGLMLFLKTKLAEIHAGTPLTSDDAAYVDDLFKQAWLDMLAIVGPPTPPSVWQTWYKANFLDVDLETWRNLEGLPSIQPGVTIPFGTVRASAGQTLLSPLAQSYTQFVELGVTDAADSLLPPGEDERDTNPHALDQGALWVGESFKPMPLTLAGVQAMGPVVTTTLSYEPDPEKK